MKKSWTNGLEEQEVLDIESSYKSSIVVRRRLEELCQAKSKASYKLTRSEYDCPNWPLLQADAVGYNRALEEIISLIK